MSLKKAKELIEAGWCQYCYATTESGLPIHWLDKRAKCYCLVGALHRASSAEDADYLRALTAEDLWRYNDYRTKEEVLLLIDNAIKLQESGVTLEQAAEMARRLRAS